jgi:hypothetical protein
MAESTAGGCNHGTCMIYVNSQREVSLVDSLVSHLCGSTLGGVGGMVGGVGGMVCGVGGMVADGR